MSDKLIIEGVPPWDGEYDFDIRFTMRELHTVKTISGIRGAEVAEAVAYRDAAATVAIAVVILARHGKLASPDDFFDADQSCIRFAFGEDDADPPAETPPSSGDETDTAASTSGDGSTADSET